MADDIVDRLRAASAIRVYSVRNLMREAADEIEMLRNEVDLKGYRLDAEIDKNTRLLQAVHLAAGLLSAMEPYEHMSPGQVLEFLSREQV